MTKAGRPSVRPSPLMLMVLVLLAEAPMHPYEMQRLMQWRGKDQVVRVQRGSLYPAVERLVNAGLIEPLETARDGRRPERTVYQLTEEGRETAETWLVTMIRTVRNEYPDFPAALSFLPMLSAGDARAQLTARLLSLGSEIAAMQSVAADLREKYDLPRLFTVEDDYRLAMLQAEHAWVSTIVEELATGDLYWDAQTIRDWAEGLQRGMGSFPGIPRVPGGDAGPPPGKGVARDASDADRDPPS
ncbi:PadR family transcriptional regulator [Nakamurella sp. GG22]